MRLDYVGVKSDMQPFYLLDAAGFGWFGAGRRLMRRLEPGLGLPTLVIVKRKHAFPDGALPSYQGG
jgi:hypothetical protein